ncbi:hypothetical protein QA942_39640 [Streptomyces sp. B21-106]|uniref:hypothetical protein n=1 Tax=Streptomyces sp. B21-106 TaxID=3039418 RepID=UPI002FF2F5AB
MTNLVDITQALAVLALAAGWALHASRLHRRLDRSRHDPRRGRRLLLAPAFAVLRGLPQRLRLAA